MPDRTLLVLDIETVPDRSLWSPEMEKQAQRKDDGRGREDPFPPPWAHQVLVAGVLWLGPDHSFRKLGLVGQGTTDEERILRDMGKFLDEHHPVLVTYNGRRFDLPVLALRSMRHGIPAAWYFHRGNAYRQRYRSDAHVDLCEELSDHGSVRRPKLDDAVRLIGLPGKLGVDGSWVDSMAARGDIAAVQKYCLTDVVQTAFLYLRYLVLRGDLDPARFRDLARALRDALASADATTELFARTDWGRYMME